MDTDEATIEATPYEPPTIERLGTLAELTQGGSGLDMDGNGGCSTPT